MADQQQVEKYVWNIANIWRKFGLDVTNYTGCTLYVMCLNKLIGDNRYIRPERMGKLVELTKILYRPTSIDDIDILRDSHYILEEAYGLKPGTLATVLTPYRSLEEGWRRAFLEIINATAEIKPDAEGYYPYAKALIYEYSKSSRTGSEIVSSDAVSDLLSIAADIQDGDTVLDGTIGYGYSAIKCLEGKKDVFLHGVDINADSIAVATMLTILSGKERYEFVQDDFTSMNSPSNIDRVVMDIPFAIKLGELTPGQRFRTQKWMDTDVCREAEALFIATGLEALNEKGRLVVVVPQGFLFKQTKSLSTFRKNLIKEGMLKTIVSLPPVYDSISVRTAMLIFERGNEDVLFIDASNLVQRERRNDAVITEESKKILKDILDNKREVEGISFMVTQGEMLETNDWSINVHRREDVGVESRNLRDINEELQKYYEKLDELNKKSFKMFE